MTAGDEPVDAVAAPDNVAVRPADGARHPGGDDGPEGPEGAAADSPLDAPAADPARAGGAEPAGAGDAGEKRATPDSRTDAGSADPGDRADSADPADAGDLGDLGDAPDLRDLSRPGADALVALTVERDDYREALIRLQADFENYKKRMIKQQTDHLERAAGVLVEKLLPVLDTADLALAHGGGEDVKQLSGTLAGVLEREGLERIDPLGAPFDPTLHDAVAHEPGEGGQEVVEVLRAGYRWKGRVLRPALVKVRG